MAFRKVWTSGSLSSLIVTLIITGTLGNKPPQFRDDINNHVIPENTPVGTVVYTLKGVDPEGSPLKYGLMGTDRLKVDEKTGIVTVARPIDREVSDRLRLSVTVEDEVKEGSENNNVVTIPVSVTISDSNDNAPSFLNQSSFENVEVVEDTEVGVKILEIQIQDPDLTGMALKVSCVASVQSPEACSIFPVEILETTAGLLRGELRLGAKLDFNKRSLYQFGLTASDGEHKSSVEVLIRIRDVQNTAPVFTGAMAGRVMEDAAVGTLVMMVQARDGDLGKPREVRLTLLSNPGEVFQLDPTSGRLTTTRPLDRETLGSLLTLGVKATEIKNPGEQEPLRASDVVSSVKNVTILIDDVNDSEPKFSQSEYFTEIAENSAVGTPLPGLDLVVSDPDTGTFADFTLKIDGPLAELFDIQPKFASGSVRPVIRIKKAFDHENPNERKFILLIIAQNTDEPELSSTATISVSTLDENDNRPKFDRDVYQVAIPEDTKPGTKIGQITAEDPDSNEYGDEGLIYQLIGTGSKRFTVNNLTGEIFVSTCTPDQSPHCTELDYESLPTYDLLYMASDSRREEPYLKSVVPLQILLSDSNDSPVTFEKATYSRTLLENSPQFEPPFFLHAQDNDTSAVLVYSILAPDNSSIHTHFKIDPHTGQIHIVKRKGSLDKIFLPPANYSFKVAAEDGHPPHAATTTVHISVLDVNNHAPTFSPGTLEAALGLSLAENLTLGATILQIRASDGDLRDNGVVRYSLDKGGYGYFEIDPVKGDLTLVKDLDTDVMAEFDLQITAYDLGTPSMRSTLPVRVVVEDVYHKLPRMAPNLQRVQVSESAEIGDVVTVLKTNWGDLGLDEGLRKELHFDFVDPVQARNPDNQEIPKGAGLEMVREWFRIRNDGTVLVASGLQRELVTAINFTVMITSEKGRPGAKELGSLMITIFEVNDKPPMVEDMEIEILEELPPGQAILTLEAEDPEGGQISHYFIEKGSEYFSVDNKTGEVKVAGRLDYEYQPLYNVTIVAVDSGVPQLSSTATIMVSLVNDNDNDPKFDKTEYDAEFEEHPPQGQVIAHLSATDLDVDSTLSYAILPSQFSPAFAINRLGELSISPEGRALLDYEALASQPEVTLSVSASDGERLGYATVRVRILDRNDNPPKFDTPTTHISLHAPLRAKQDILRVGAKGGDSPQRDAMHFRIVAGNEDGIFEVDSESGVLRAAQAYEKAGEMSLTLEVDDLGGQEGGEEDKHTDRTQVLVQILPGNFKKPEFLFPNKINSTLLADESDAEEIAKFENSNFTKVLGQILAFDPDEGDAGRIQYFFQTGSNLVAEAEGFRIDPESGKVAQIRPLDREQMNRYDLLVVAKDSGIPVSTQSQHVLTIQVRDIDDHTPYFSRRQYDFSVKENSPENTFIGQVSARDEDEGGHGQIFYFLVSSPETGHFKEDLRVDIKTGMIHSNAILDRERIPSYQLYVRAASSPIVNKSMQVMLTPEEFMEDTSLTAINITVIDENDNSPRFPEKQYYAAINSEAEPGREIMTLNAVDVDSTLSSPVVYSLLGANLILDDFRSGGSVIPSPFRVDPSTGRLTLSQSAMRQYSGGNNRFQVKIGVRETVPPYHSDATQVQVWVVESGQETILTVKSPPKSLFKEGLIDVLTNITGSYVLITRISPHVGEDLVVNKEWSDVYVTAIDKGSLQPVSVSQFLAAVDLSHDKLRNADMPIVLHSAVPAQNLGEGTEGGGYFNGGDAFDAAFAGLIALIALLCMGLAAIIACCCCINRMYDRDTDSEKQTIYGPMKYPLHASHPSIPGTPNMNIGRINPGHISGGGSGVGGEMVEDSATDNPLWIDHKVKTYEEQELTMQVASELDNSNGSVDIDVDVDVEDGRYIEEDEDDDHVKRQMHPSHRQMRQLSPQMSPQFSHAYATLHPHPQRLDYDNINILGEDTIAVHL